jgi:hypothetical protein
MRLILGTIGLFLVTFSGLTLSSMSWARDNDPQPCEWLLAPTSEYNGFLRAAGKAGKFITENSKIAKALIDTGRAAASPLKLYFPVATSEDKSMVILGSPFSRRETARTILAEINKFDDYFSGWGLLKPEKTAIVVSGWTGLPRLVPENPMASQKPILLLASGDIRAAMFMRSDVNKSNQALMKYLYFHERSHHRLDWTFARHEFISQQAQVQEAFADFLPAYYMNVDPGTLAKAAQMDRWESQGPEPRRKIHTAVLPSILWRISRMMPESRARVFFPHFIKELNRNAYAAGCLDHWHVVGFMMKAGDFEASRNCAAALFMAVARKLAPELDFSHLIADVEAQLSIQGMTANIEEKISEPEPFSPFVHVDEPSAQVAPHLIFGGLVTCGQYLVSFEFYRMIAEMLGGS